MHRGHIRGDGLCRQGPEPCLIQQPSFTAPRLLSTRTGHVRLSKRCVDGAAAERTRRERGCATTTLLGLQQPSSQAPRLLSTRTGHVRLSKRCVNGSDA
ncbi:hypothetical protein NDU88_011206 [Pleurodeles waltl]|uniref:Uncharacterized protein n=1 Tax=Pleurodeles waltl TaxID=8319 RepID=A0AAV7Q4D5_PLEWA|nr:hypothetical protein NDU88_011206 [Pleurodeles waltl]